MWAHGISALVGLWLMVAPALIGTFSETASANNRIFGPIVVAIGVIALWEVMRSVRFGNTLIGIWMLIACLVLGYQDAALISNALSAVIIIALSLVRGEHDPLKFGGGWKALWDDELWKKGQKEDA